MQDFRNLRVWKKAHSLTLLIYRLTVDFPREELFGLRSSLRRTSADISTFIAEGCGKPSDTEFSRSLYVALGLAGKLEYYALLARDLEILKNGDYQLIDSDIVEVKKMLSGFSRKIAVKYGFRRQRLRISRVIG